MTTETVGNIRPIRIEEEMRASYLDYAMSVIVARALPDVRDGLKPVQKRILYAMSELGLRPSAAYKKSARIVGEVLGKFHPHGDDPVYEAMVRMAQDFSMRYPLVDGQGNFGSVDNDPPAAMRYTEARLASIAEEMLADIDRNTVDFAPNFDGSLTEPTVLPARLPNLLVNGASGIAVGMATNIPPHNLGEICDAIAFLIDNPEASSEELAELVQGPDFPTGGIIFGRKGIKSAFADGRGRVIVRARVRIDETRGGRHAIVVSELPYQVNKAALVQRIADLVRKKQVEGISDLRDESDRHGMRIVVELSRVGQPQQILNALYKHTAMQSSFAINMLAIVEGQPRTIRLRTALEHHINFRREVIRRRSEFDLERARERGHILEGLLKAIKNLDQVIRTIRRAQSAEQAKEHLMRAPFRLSDRQAQAVLDMQLRRLARLERQKIEEEYAEIIKQISYLEDLLANPRKIDFLIREDAQDLKKKHGDPRRTQIVAREIEDFSEEDLIPHQEVVVALSNRGYIKRVPVDTYRPQHRGGRGITGMITREADAVRRLLVADTHTSLLFFTDRGRVFQLKTHEVPDVSRQARGLPLINLIDINQGELVTAVVAASSFDKDFMVLATRRGEVKKTPLSAFASVRRAGLIAMDLEKDDELIGARLMAEDEHVLLATAAGLVVRYPVRHVPSRSRAAGGVIGVRLTRGDRVVGLEVARPGRQLLTITTDGYGKRTPVEEFPAKNRPWKGVIGHALTGRGARLIAARIVDDRQEVMLISEQGVVLRTQVLYERIDLPGGGQSSRGIPVYGRSSQGVTIMNVGPGDAVASVALIELSEESGSPAPKDTPAETPPPKGERRPKKPVTKQPRPKAMAKGPSSPAGQRAAPARPTTRAARPRAGTAAAPPPAPRPRASASSARPATSSARPRPSTAAAPTSAPRPRTSAGAARPTTSYKERYEGRIKTGKARGEGRAPGGREAARRRPKASSRTSRR